MRLCRAQDSPTFIARSPVEKNSGIIDEDTKLTPWWVAEGLAKYARTDELLALRARVAQLEAALRFLLEDTKWKSVDKDNMEFEGRVTCYQLDRGRAALSGEPTSP